MFFVTRKVGWVICASPAFLDSYKFPWVSERGKRYERAGKKVAGRAARGKPYPTRDFGKGIGDSNGAAVCWVRQALRGRWPFADLRLPLYSAREYSYWLLRLCGLGAIDMVLCNSFEFLRSAFLRFHVSMKNLCVHENLCVQEKPARPGKICMVLVSR